MRFRYCFRGVVFLGLVFFLGFLVSCGGGRRGKSVSFLGIGRPKPSPSLSPVKKEYLSRLYFRHSKKDGAFMAWIPAGKFKMGKSPKDSMARSDEYPLHDVYTDAYFIYTTPVTVSMFKRFVDKTGYFTTAERSAAPVTWWNKRSRMNFDAPVTYVSYEDAKAYCKWAGGRLPTEAEWEKAARGVKDARIYPWGDTFNKNYFISALMDEEHWRKVKPPWAYDIVPCPVGRVPKGKSPFDCFDMIGNCWEWTSDWYSRDYIEHPDVINPKGPSTGKFKVIKGGGLSANPIYYRISCREPLYPEDWRDDVSFRCVVPCTSNEPPAMEPVGHTPPKEPLPLPPAAPIKPIKGSLLIGVLYYQPYNGKVEESLRWAEKKYKVKFYVFRDEGQAKGQVVLFKEILKKKPRAVLIEPMDPPKADKMVELAKKKGIYTFVMGLKPDHQKPVSVTLMDTQKAGEEILKEVASLMKDKGEVLIFTPSEGSTGYRVGRAFAEKYYAESKIEHVSLVVLKGEEDSIRKQMRDSLSMKNLKVVFVTDVRFALSLCDVLKEEKKDILVVAFNYFEDPILQERLKSGEIKEIFVADVEKIPQLAVKNMMKYLREGKKIPRVEKVGVKVLK